MEGWRTGTYSAELAVEGVQPLAKSRNALTHFVLGALLLAGCKEAPTAPDPGPLSGSWTGGYAILIADDFPPPIVPELALELDHRTERITGTLTDPRQTWEILGTVQGDAVTIEGAAGERFLQLDLRLQGDELHGMAAEWTTGIAAALPVRFWR